MSAGPPPVAPGAPPEPDELGELTDDAVTSRYRLWQRRRGHRYSLDDVLTAWEAATLRPDACCCLELGTGIGSVLLMLAHALPEARFVAVEAQRNSFRLLERNVARNGLGERVRRVHGDFRALDRAQLPEAPFELITGTPPYAPPGRATPSSDAQRAYARQEFRGGVEAYVETASRLLAPGGRLVVCGDARTPERVERAGHAAGLVVLRRRDVVPRRAHKGALFSVFTLAHAGEASGEAEVRVWEARDADGARTEAYRAMRRFFGLAGSRDELPSP